MKTFAVRLFPILMTVVLITTYIISNKLFIECNWGDYCVKIETANISEVPLNQESNLNKIPALLTTKKKDLDEKKESVKIYEQAVNKTNADLAETVKAQSLAANANALGANTNTLKEKKVALNAVLKNQTENLTRLKTDSNTAEKQVQEIRKQVAERYSKRLMFMFLTGAFMLLCLTAVIISVTVIRESINSLDNKSKKLWGLPILEYWQFIAAAAAIIFGLVIYFFFEAESLAVVSPMYNQSIWTNGDISEGLIHFINCVNFTATIWLIFAANAVLFAVKSNREVDIEAEAKNLQNEAEAQRLATEIDELKKQMAVGQDAAKQVELSKQIAGKQQMLLKLPAKKINFFELCKRNITTVLYIGGLMLFVGMMRMKIVADWHLIFVSTEITNPFYVMLNNFFNSLLTVQAGFYSILLMVIYLPVVYAMMSVNTYEMPSVETQDAASGSSLLEKLRLPFSSEFMVKAFAIFLPALAGPSVDFFNYILGETS